MQSQLSQRTLGALRRILEDMPRYVDAEDEVIEPKRFWKDTLFDFGFAPAVIDVASSYEFKWGEIIPDLFIARFGQQNSNFSNALPPYVCDQTLNRLIAFGLFYSRDIRLGDELRQALADDGFDLKRDQDNDFGLPADVQQKLQSVVSEAELEIINIVVDRFLNLHQSTPRKPLVIKFKSPEMLERLVRCGVLKTNDQGQHYLPLSLAFHYSGDTAAVDRASKAVEITLNVLRNLYEVDPDKPESHFKFPEIEVHARKMYENLEEGELKFGLYLLQEFSGVLGQYGSNIDGTEVNFVGISEDIVTKDFGTAWDEHIERRSQFIEREEARKRIKSSQQTYLEPMHLQSMKPEPVNQKPLIQEIEKETVTQPNKPKILVLISHSSKDVDLATALIELLRGGLGLLATQIRCSSVDGYRLPAGVDTDAQLRKEIADAGVLVGLLTPNSLSSTYVLFELGARWGIQRPMIPLLAGVTPDEMRGPHRVLNALSCSNESQLIQFIEDTGRELSIDPQSSSSYLDKVRTVKKLADSVGAHPAATREASPLAKKPNLVVKREVYLSTLFLLGEAWSKSLPHGMQDPGRGPQYQAIYAEVKNAGKEGEEVGAVHDVKAELVVGTEEFMPLPWLDHRQNSVHFDFGAVRYVVLAVGMTTNYPQLGDWRIAINNRENASPPGMKFMDFDHHLKRVMSEQKIRLNLLHVTSGTILKSVEGVCRWTEGSGIPHIHFE